MGYHSEKISIIKNNIWLKDSADVSTVFENCSLSKMVFFDPSLKGLTFHDVGFHDVGFYDGQQPSLYPIFDCLRKAFFIVVETTWTIRYVLVKKTRGIHYRCNWGRVDT